MSLEQPEGRIVINTGVGQCDKVNESDINEYGFIGDEFRQYNIDGKIVSANRFKKSISELKKIKF